MTRWLKACATLILFVLIFALSQFAATHIAIFIGGGVEFLREDFGFMLTYLMAVTLALILTSLMQLLRGGRHMRVEHHKAGFSPTYILFGVALLVMLSVVLMPLSELLPTEERVFPRGGWTIFAVVIIAPIAEELLFRVKLYDMLTLDVTPSVSVLLSALCFGVVHIEPIVAIEALFAGIIFSYFYIQRHSIYSAIVLHMANNSIAYLVTMFRYQERTLLDFATEGRLFEVMYMLSVAALLFASVKIARRLRKQDRLVAMAEDGVVPPTDDDDEEDIIKL